MHKVPSPCRVATRVQYVVAFEECGRRRPGLSARRDCAPDGAECQRAGNGPKKHYFSRLSSRLNMG